MIEIVGEPERELERRPRTTLLAHQVGWSVRHASFFAPPPRKRTLKGAVPPLTSAVC